MNSKLSQLTIKHHRIENPESATWCLAPLAHKGGTRVNNRRKKYLEEVAKLPHKKDSTIDFVRKLKAHAESSLDTGGSVRTLITALVDIKSFVNFMDENNREVDSLNSLSDSLFAYSEHQFIRANLNQIKKMSAYDSIIRCANFLNGAIDDFNFDINHTRIKKERKSRRVLGREAEKVKLKDASKLANFCYGIIQKFEPECLKKISLPILIEINNKIINLTPARTKRIDVDTDFFNNEAYMAFNFRVVAEVIIFLGMTMQNQSPTYNLRRSKFYFKPIGHNYEVREYKHRRGGDVLFKIPKPYRPYFESYLLFLDNYAPDSIWLFPYLEKNKGFRKRTDMNTNRFKSLCERYDIPWVTPSSFRSIGENMLLRISSDEQVTADYANHAIATFRESYELPSLQKAIVEVTRFWDKNDPLNNESLTISLFSSPCNGVPESIGIDIDKLPKPDCINPTGCIGCSHYRDEESFDYVWSLLSFKYLKTIESNSYLSNEIKPSNIAIDWANSKIQWFNKSSNELHRSWVSEAKMRIEEGDYHSIWSRKIEKYEG